MNERSYSNRIALNFLTATAVLIVVVFTSIYLVVYKTVYNHLNNDLDAECREVASGIAIIDGEFIFNDQAEWSEIEHGQIEVNPIFIQVADTTGNIIKKSPNLMRSSLDILNDENHKIFFNSKLSTGRIRQLQMTLPGQLHKNAGYISVAVPLEESQMLLKNLLVILLSVFPIVLFVLYLITRFIAQKSITPVKILTERAGKISRENLNERISLPQRKDELYTLTVTINNLLDRIEDMILLEKQFSSNASHELRTPLSVLKGTLGLMIRKPRDIPYYIEKTNTCLEEVNRMSLLVDQLLLLARYEKDIPPYIPSAVNLTDLINNIIARHVNSLELKSITLDLDVERDLTVTTDPFMTEQIIENIFSNAIKYSGENGIIKIFSQHADPRISLTIRDEGIGMNKEELPQIFNRFFRADKSRSSVVKGYGLGLSIAKRFADLLQITINVESRPEQGSSFTLVFPENNAPKKI